MTRLGQCWVVLHKRVNSPGGCYKSMKLKEFLYSAPLPKA